MSLNFTLTATDTAGLTGTDSAVVTVSPSIPLPCKDVTPVSTFTAIGGGQSSTVNATLSITFTGQIVSHTNNSVKMCNGTVGTYESTSTAGVAICNLDGTASASTGSFAAGSKLICTNKPTGSDTDRWRILGVN
mgnify:FL=1